MESSPITKKYYSYADCIEDCKVLIPQIKAYEPDALIAIARGGLLLGHLLSEALETREIYSLNSIHYDGMRKLDTFEIFNIPDLSRKHKIVLIDDIVDSGESMVEIIKILKEKYHHCEFKIATVFYKPTALIQPDFTVKEAKDWIEFFWEIDLLEKK
ncbi:phosphoribosyltransferase family protein [Arcobacteraceae bacterium]|jgi:xanthine phosphoribosyltransferase|nr:phosphoribosyltransferase family protein [Arcobacteraceae bacterium]